MHTTKTTDDDRAALEADVSERIAWANAILDLLSIDSSALPDVAELQREHGPRFAAFVDALPLKFALVVFGDRAAHACSVAERFPHHNQ
jgi:hypothetical protein